MQTIGLIGGITPQSTIMYYQVLNDLAAQTFGGIHSCKVIINSLDFGEISELQSQSRWDKLDSIMKDAALSLEKSGAGLIVICANTMHLCVEAIKRVVTIPVVHIAEATAKSILDKNIRKVALLGTKYTMEKPFFKEILKSFGIETIIPNESDRDTIHKVIYEELSKGLLLDGSKKAYLEIIDKLIDQGAEGIILGCTEIPLLIKQDDVLVPVFDTTTIHATTAFGLAQQLIKIN
jgi:aspartate racemase